MSEPRYSALEQCGDDYIENDGFYYGLRADSGRTLLLHQCCLEGLRLLNAKEEPQ